MTENERKTMILADTIKGEKEQKQEKSCNTCSNYDKQNGCTGTYDYMCECTDNNYKHWTPYHKDRK